MKGTEVGATVSTVSFTLLSLGDRIFLNILFVRYLVDTSTLNKLRVPREYSVGQTAGDHLIKLLKGLGALEIPNTAPDTREVPVLLVNMTIP